MTLQEETEQATDLLKGKIIASVTKLQRNEVLIEFTDKARMFIDCKENNLEISITGGINDKN